MKIAPKLLDFTSLNHHCQGFISISLLTTLAPVAALKDFLIVQYALVVEVVGNPFVEVEAPVNEGMSHISHFLAVSVLVRE